MKKTRRAPTRKKTPGWSLDHLVNGMRACLVEWAGDEWRRSENLDDLLLAAREACIEHVQDAKRYPASFGHHLDICVEVLLGQTSLMAGRYACIDWRGTNLKKDTADK